MGEVVVKNATKKKVAPKKAASKKVVPPKEKEPELELVVEAPKGFIIAEGGPYVAIRKCFFGNVLYEPQRDPGRTLDTVEGQIIPYHFKKK